MLQYPDSGAMKRLWVLYGTSHAFRIAIFQAVSKELNSLL